MSRLPILIDREDLLNRLEREERTIHAQIASLEAEIRQFEDLERPAYEDWLRLELGPRISTLEEILFRIHEKRILVHRLNELIETHRLHPREALYVLRNVDRPEPEEGEEKPAAEKSRKGWSKEEIEARRQAKREAKREARREKKKTLKEEVSASSDSLSQRLASLYRELAKKLHPDSATRALHISDSRLLILWMEVQKAYGSRNLERLISIATWLSCESGGEFDLGRSELTYSERLSRLRALKKTLRNLEGEISRMGDHPAWGFNRAKPQQRRKARQGAQRALEEEIAEAQELLDELEDLLHSIGPPRPPKRKVKR